MHGYATHSLQSWKRNCRQPVRSQERALLGSLIQTIERVTLRGAAMADPKKKHPSPLEIEDLLQRRPRRPRPPAIGWALLCCSVLGLGFAYLRVRLSSSCRRSLDDSVTEQKMPSRFSTPTHKNLYFTKKRWFFLSTSDFAVPNEVLFVPSSNELSGCMKSIGQSVYHQAWQGMHRLSKNQLLAVMCWPNPKFCSPTGYIKKFRETD
jgi:hypothetical protein